MDYRLCGNIKQAPQQDRFTRGLIVLDQFRSVSWRNHSTWTTWTSPSLLETACSIYEHIAVQASLIVTRSLFRLPKRKVAGRSIHAYLLFRSPHRQHVNQWLKSFELYHFKPDVNKARTSSSFQDDQSNRPIQLFYFRRQLRGLDDSFDKVSSGMADSICRTMAL